MNTDKGKFLIQNPFQIPCKNNLFHAKKGNSSNKTLLTSSERLIFSLRDRQDLTREIVEKLPEEIYYKIVQTPSTAKTNLIHKINQLCYIFPENSHRVIRPNSLILRPESWHAPVTKNLGHRKWSLLWTGFSFISWPNPSVSLINHRLFKITRSLFRQTVFQIPFNPTNLGRWRVRTSSAYSVCHRILWLVGLFCRSVPFPKWWWIL